jgi:hypothetical protein
VLAALKWLRFILKGSHVSLILKGEACVYSQYRVVVTDMLEQRFEWKQWNAEALGRGSENLLCARQ